MVNFCTIIYKTNKTYHYIDVGSSPIFLCYSSKWYHYCLLLCHLKYSSHLGLISREQC
jgi:hypothetical protein